jgi:hypothetical protein
MSLRIFIDISLGQFKNEGFEFYRKKNYFVAWTGSVMQVLRKRNI